jgi:cell division protein FtsB
MPDFLKKLRTLAAYHASINLAVHVQHAEEVIRKQRAALLEAADRIEELEAEVARLRAGG